MNQQDLKNKLKEKINQKKLGRCSNIIKENYKNNQLKAMGLDEEKYNESLKLIRELSEKDRENLFKSLQEQKN